MNKQQEEDFFKEEKDFNAKRVGCLLILSVLIAEAVAVAFVTAYYLKHKDTDKNTEPVKVFEHNNKVIPKIQSEKMR